MEKLTQISTSPQAEPPTPELLPPHKAFAKKFFIWLTIIVLIAAGTIFVIDFYNNCTGLKHWLTNCGIVELIPEDIVSQYWQTYRNEEYGYEIRYPHGWKVSEDNSHTSLMPIGGQDFNLLFFVFDKSLIETERSLPIFSVPERKVDSRTSATMNGINWTKLIIDSNQIVQLTFRNGKTYVAQYSTLEDISPRIFSTFKFIKQSGEKQSESPDTNNWQTYRSKQYGFEFQYPADLVQSDPYGSFFVFLRFFDPPGKFYDDYTTYEMLAFRRHDLPKEPFTKEWLEENYRYNLGIGLTKVKIGEVNVGGELALTIASPEDKYPRHYVIATHNDLLIIEMVKITDEKTLLNDVFSTIKFIPISSVVCPAPEYISPHCPKVITRAKNIKTGEIKEFPDGCLPQCWAEY